MTGKENKENYQIHITEKTPLLTKRGELTACGYATTDLWNYNKENLAQKGKLKEWEFYQISNEKWLLQLTYGHITYAGNASVTLVEFDGGKRYSCGIMKFLPCGSFNLDFTSGQNHKVKYLSPKLKLCFEKNQSGRKLSATADDKGATAEINLSMSEKGDAMCYVMPFKRKLFYYNFKRFFTDLQGSISVNGKQYEIDEKTHCLIDSGRGCWPYRHSWLWGMAQGEIKGKLFAFDIGYGSSDKGQTTENMLFENGVAHKLGKITATYDEKDFLKPWSFSSDDGRFEMEFTPFFDNFTETNFLVVHNRCHQVFGYYTGKAVLDDGREIIVDKLNGFCEVAKNRW